MKKIIFVIAISMLMLLNCNKTKASNWEEYEVSRISANDNILDSTAIGKMGNRFIFTKLIPIESEESYIIVVGKKFTGMDLNSWGDSFDIIFFDEYREEVTSIEVFFDDTNYYSFLYASFSVPSNCCYLTSETPFPFLNDVEASYAKDEIMMCKYPTGDNQSLTKFINEFKGFIPFVPASEYSLYKSENQYYIVSPSSDPIQVEEIKRMFYLKDINSNETCTIDVINDGYKNTNVTGTYLIEFKALDNKLNSTSIKVNVLVADTSSPNIISTGEECYLELGHFNPGTICNLIFQANYTVGVGETVSYHFLDDYEVYGTLYVPGRYECSIVVTDNNGNSTTVTCYYNVKDTTGPNVYLEPYIIDKTTFDSMTSLELSDYAKEYLASKSITPKSVKIIKNEYEEHPNENGKYRIDFSYINDKDEEIIDSYFINVNCGIQSNSINQKTDAKRFDIGKYLVLGSSGLVFLTAIFFFIRKRKHI